MATPACEGSRRCAAQPTPCGWSSVLRSLAAAVPMVALPPHIDRPLNGNLGSELAAGARVCRSSGSASSPARRWRARHAG
ncbi:hypothetical protein ACP4OV_007464 [Aristida adscensionis]